MMPVDLPGLLQLVSVLALPAIFAITLHEAAHGFVAHRCGDDTAWRLGRVTFNPMRHIDPFGTVILPLMLLLLTSSVPGGPFLFGFAKPVPVAYDRLRHPRRDMVWVAIAGPATNVALALFSALLVYLVPYLPHVMQLWFASNLYYSMLINVILAVFNMIPLPPLDGGRVAVGLLPETLAWRLARVERYGILILVGLLFLLPMLGTRLGVDLNPMTFFMERPVGWILSTINWVTGVSL